MQKLWAVRPDYIGNLHRNFAAGIEPDITSEERRVGRIRVMKAMDSLPVNLRRFVHENGQLPLVHRYWLVYRNEARVIQIVIEAIERDNPRHSVCLNDEKAEAEALLESLGL